MRLINYLSDEQKKKKNRKVGKVADIPHGK